jgi:regulator of cell morphogenesis and NO signaling
MSNESRIEPGMTVNEVIRRAPVAVTVFKRYGIDACCGGGLPVGEAAARHGIDEATLIAELQRTADADSAGTQVA